MLRTVTSVVALASSVAALTPVVAEDAAGHLAVEMQARPFDLKQVRLLDGPFKEAMDRDRRYLRELDSDRLLHTFRINAGLPSSADPLGGWERPSCEVRGHTLGHVLSACALMYASTGDQELKAKADRIVRELGRCQTALGESGYLSAFPESFIDRVEACERVWAPYYTLHKILAGLLEVHRRCGNEQALEISRRMAAWAKGRLENLDRAQMQRVLNATEQGGMNEALANLYAVTGDPAHLALARRFDQDRYTEPLARGEDRLQGEHVNSFIPNMIGTARQYELTGNTRDRDIAVFFWNQVVGARSYATGGTSNSEHWRTPPYKLASELGDHTQETCCTYNMLKLTRRLFCWSPEARYADYYERALYNSILATQSPETGMMMYFVVLAPGRWKVFNLPNDSFWCCTGTGMENHATYGDSIYFQGRDGLFVNLFIASELDWKEKGVRIRQETRFPEEGRTTLIVRTGKPTDFALRVRVPYWATAGLTIRLNGKPLQPKADPSSYLTVRRRWEDGDRLQVSLPMNLHADSMPDDRTLKAFLYGPLVLAGELGGQGLTAETTHTSVNWYKFRGVAPAPYFIAPGDDLNAWIKPLEERPLAFRTVGQTHNVTLVPYYKLFGQRYAIYWHVYRRGSPEHRERMADDEARRRRQARIVDEVLIGDRESETSHDLKGERTGAGRHAGREWRHATGGGWFSYALKVLPDKPMTLVCTYWGSDTGARSFDILIDGVKIATQTLDRQRPGEFFDVQHRIPPDFSRGKRRVTVKFQAHPGNYAGGVFGCAVLRPPQ